MIPSKVTSLLLRRQLDLHDHWILQYWKPHTNSDRKITWSFLLWLMQIHHLISYQWSNIHALQGYITSRYKAVEYSQNARKRQSYYQNMWPRLLQVSIRGGQYILWNFLIYGPINIGQKAVQHKSWCMGFGGGDL